MSTSLILISVGNTRTRLALSKLDTLEPSQVFESTDAIGIAKAAAELLQSAPENSPSTAVIATVNLPATDQISAALVASGIRVLRFGRELTVPIANTLDDDSTVGQDRLLDAIGAFARSKQACIIIDAGTAITVDFVDGEGTFHGGAIAPGVNLMLSAMHQHTAALPKITLSRDLLPEVSLALGSGRKDDPELETDEGADSPAPRLNASTPFGKDTRKAMAIGVVSAARGMAHELIDRYAEFYEAYPRIIATGGDAPLLFEHDPLVEAIVPDLTLLGMLEALKIIDTLESGDDHDE